MALIYNLSVCLLRGALQLYKSIGRRRWRQVLVIA